MNPYDHQLSELITKVRDRNNDVRDDIRDLDIIGQSLVMLGDRLQAVMAEDDRVQKLKADLLGRYALASDPPPRVLRDVRPVDPKVAHVADQLVEPMRRRAGGR